MKCGFCGREFPSHEGKPDNPCGRCLGKCQNLYCPYCGYGNPVLPGYFRRRKKNRKSKECGDE